MNHRRSALALSILLLVANATGALAVSQGEVLQAGREYRGERRLQSPMTGVSFVVPSGFTAAYDPEVQGVLMVNPSMQEAMGGVWGASQITIEELVTAVGETLMQAGIQVAARAQPMMTASEFSGSFNAQSPGGVGVLFARAKSGPGGNAVLVAVMGPGAQESTLKSIADGVAASFEITTAQAQTVARQIGGAVLSTNAGGSDMSTGGGATATGVSSSWEQLDLCSNGQYQYQSRSETFVSIPGASASNESSDQHVGNWRLIADLVGSMMLVLEATDGREFVWAASESGEQIVLEGTSYYVSQSQVCR